MGIHEKVKIEKVYTGINRGLELIDLLLLMNSIGIYEQTRASKMKALRDGTRKK